MPLLREAGVTISTDLHDWDGINPYHEPFALAADIVFVSATALADPERTMRDIAARGRARIVVATAGAGGAHVLADGELTHVPAVTPPASVVDSNGAGDAFASAFLLGWLDGEDPRRCALYGAVASRHRRPHHHGARRPGPTRRLRPLTDSRACVRPATNDVPSLKSSPPVPAPGSTGSRRIQERLGWLSPIEFEEKRCAEQTRTTEPETPSTRSGQLISTFRTTGEPRPDGEVISPTADHAGPRPGGWRTGCQTGTCGPVPVPIDA